MSTSEQRQQQINQTIKRKAKALKDRISAATQVMKDTEAELRDLQAMCPHTDAKHHPRQIAEDDPWDECLICGAVF